MLLPEGLNRYGRPYHMLLTQTKLMHKNTHSMLNKTSYNLIYLSLFLLSYVPRQSNHSFLKVFECYTFVSVCKSLFNEHNQFALLRNQCQHVHAFPPTATQHTSERKATHKHDTIVIKLQINKCFTSVFKLYTEPKL